MSHPPTIDLETLAQHIAAQHNFYITEEIYRGYYYTKDHLRNIMLSGTYEGKRAVLKVYDDPRVTTEPQNQQAYNEHNASTLMRAPEVYASAMTSAQTGWMIMEHLPEGGAFLTAPVADKAGFAKLFLEYRTHFPSTPTRPLFLPEQLSVVEFQVFRISRWFELATKAEADRQVQGETCLLAANTFVPRYERVLEALRQGFQGRRLVWCHGHFKPQEIYKVSETQYYLTDFGHTRMYPEGYELGFIVWADYLMSANWNVSYAEWKQGVDEWITVLTPIAEQLYEGDSARLLHLSMLERSIGALLADVVASDRPRGELEARVSLLLAYIDDCLNVVQYIEH